MNDNTTLTILLIEDNPHDANLVQELLVQAKLNSLLAHGPGEERTDEVEVTHEDTLQSGLDRAPELQPDAVLLDLQLPDSDGIETVTRALAELPDLPVVVLTGMPEQQLGMKAVSEGAQDYLVKDNITSQTLAMAIQYAIERKQTEQELRRRSEQLAMLNQLTRHDIKNDISLIVGRTEELTDYVDPRGQDIVEEIIQSGNHILQLTRTIGDALDSMTTDETPELSPTDLNAILQREVEKARSLYRSSEITMGDVPDADVRGNRLLASVFGNLISNGVFFNDKSEAKVHIDGTVEGDTVTVRVADNGPGIPRRQRDRIFEEGIQSVESSGIGVGLTLVDRLVTQYGGRIRIEDNDPDGSVFCVELERA